MSTTHTVVGSPLGDLTLVADDGSLTGLYFRHHWYRPDPASFGPGTAPGSATRPASSPSTSPGAERVRPPLDPRGEGPSAGLDTDQPHPVRADHQLRRPGRRVRRRVLGQGRRPGGGPQPAVGDRALPPRRRQGRQPHRLRRRAGPEAVPARPGRAPRGREAVLTGSRSGMTDGQTAVRGRRQPSTARRCCGSAGPCSAGPTPTTPGRRRFWPRSGRTRICRPTRTSRRGW